MRFLRCVGLLGCSLAVACGGAVEDTSPVDAAADSGMVTDSATPVDARPRTDARADTSAPVDSAADTAPADTTPRPDTGTFDVIIQGEGLGAWEGKTITFVTVNDPVPSGITVTGKITSGKVTAFFPATMPNDVFGFFVDVWIDVGGDGACTTGTDPIYTHFVGSALKDPVYSTFDPGESRPKSDCAKVGLR